MGENPQTKIIFPLCTQIGIKMAFYNQWRKNPCDSIFEFSKRGDFQKRLLADEVDAFDLTQDCNMHGEYTRCFYRLKGNETIYEETPCDEPRIGWKTIGNKLTRCYKPRQMATWSYIQERFVETETPYQVRYERKVVFYKMR